MMQGLHHQQQQLAALLAVALPKDDSAPPSTQAPNAAPPTITSTAASSTIASTGEAAAAAPPQPEDSYEASRVSAVTSLHRAICYPPNSLLITHSASFLAQGFSQLLSDKSYSVRQAAATGYGALCAVLNSIPIASNGRQNHVILNSLVDRFIGWALPSLSGIGEGTAELALEGLREFLSVGDVGAVERYALPILKACQELLEDERTSLSLLHRLLAVLTLISMKFFRFFQPHFVDIVDLLLGWAMVPDLAESDRHVIMDSFLQFQKHWVNNLQFSLGLLSKFLGDMDVLLQDGSPGTPQQFQRLLALLSCFSTVLQSVASGLLEINMLEQISEPLCKMIPLLLGCLSLIGTRFGWSTWIEDSWRCLTLLAEILSEKFSSFYPAALDILFRSLETESKDQLTGNKKITTFQVHGVLKTNLHLLSLQKLGLLPSSVDKILQFEAPISQLRLHPNHLVTGSAAATYVFLLQHGNNDVVEKATSCLIEELELLKDILNKIPSGRSVRDSVPLRCYSKSELIALLKFDLKVILNCVSFGGGCGLIGQADFDTLYVSRSEKLASCITEKLNLFELPIRSCIELQVTVLNTLKRLTIVELLRKWSVLKESSDSSRGTAAHSLTEEKTLEDAVSEIFFEYLKKYATLLGTALHISSPLAVKIEALQWISKWCEHVININQHLKATYHPYKVSRYMDINQNLLFSILNAASDREPKVRLHVASVLEMLLQGKLIHPSHLPDITEIVLEKLGDPQREIKTAFVKLLSDVLPITVYFCGLHGYGIITAVKAGSLKFSNGSILHWKQLFALRQLPQQLHSQQLVSILSYISQRWKVPLSSWIHRLIQTCKRSKDLALIQSEESRDAVSDSLWWADQSEEDILERICSVNILSGAWWAIHEAARYCITTRLRTNLGGPTQTFAALERMLLDIAHVLQLDTEQNDGNLNIIGSSYTHLLPMRLLLEFVEALKKNVYNAYEGSIVLSCTSRPSSLFFRANKKVCEEWFSRICEPMMNAGLALQCHDATNHYCALRLQELSKHVSSSLKDKSRTSASEKFHNVGNRGARDIMRVLRNIALALCKNCEPEALIGIQKWASMTFSALLQDENWSPDDGGTSGHFSWINGLVFQAKSQHEKAAAHFIDLLQTEESLTSMGSDGVQFAIARIIENYAAVSDWKSLECWLLELQTLRSKHAGKSYSGALTMAGNEVNSIQALARFDEGDFEASWACLDLTPKSSSELTLDPKLALQRSEQMLLQAMLLHSGGKVDEVSHELQRGRLMLEEILSVLPLDGIVEAAPYINQLGCIFAFEESSKNRGSKDEHFEILLGSYIQSLHSPINQLCQDCNMWLKVFRVFRTTVPASPVTLKLCKSILNLARKQRNLMLAGRLAKYLKDQASGCSDQDLRDFLVCSLQYEDILLMHAENKHEDALMNAWSFVRPCMVSYTSAVSDSPDNSFKAMACLKLSKWLKKDHVGVKLENIVRNMLSDFNVTETSCRSGSLSFSDDTLGSKQHVDLIVEELVGSATKLSSLLCPTMGKTWISFASWCYDQARSSLTSSNSVPLPSCSFSSIIASEIYPQRFSLTEEERLEVKKLLSQIPQRRSFVEGFNVEGGDIDVLTGLSESLHNENDLEALLEQVISIIEASAAAPGVEDSGSEYLSATVSSELQKCFASQNVMLDQATISPLVRDLVNVWWALRKRRVSLFGHAAQAFIKYLSCSSSRRYDGQLSNVAGPSKYDPVGYNLRATLCVLHILLNYGVELQDTLEPVLSTAPLSPWQDITPQLFSRLSSHPERVVRKQLENLLVMLAKRSPWSIVYPTLVDANAYSKEPSEEIQFILACLNKLHPRLVQDVQLMIRELKNVTVLWEELWLSTLQDLHADVMRWINLLKEEAARVSENVTLSHGEKNKINAAKYSAMMAPVIVVLERRLASTSRKPETPHEKWFHEEFGEPIRSAILNFKTPPTSAAALGEVWRPFDGIAASLASYQRKSSLSLGEVSPQLVLLSSSEAPMPGLEKEVVISEPESRPTTHEGIVTIASFSEQVTVLSTKTKPKKIHLLGSDGQKYTYLLKGREDLRLDARIMQLLQAVNGFLHSSATLGHSVGIRYYSVTPISGQAGLIQWVDNVISIYTVFKSWQTRVQLAQLSTQGAGNTNDMSLPPVPRPIDMFYGKIIPALKEKGIRRVISRRDWPQDVKLKVLLDLMNEAPKQLLHQELWCASEGFKAFSSKMKRYSGTLAAMSMVGHVLGLGDRHLDNILIDFCTGDILHIDYNVCFDKGQRLKVPEIVPFRLTQIVEAALGLTGIEGTFRAYCEEVLGVLKQNKDVILMLLEAFVWDPLVEWTRGDFHDDAAIVGEERKGMELAVSLSLFASRVQEIRVPLQEHHDLLLTTLPAVESALERFEQILHQYEIVAAVFYRADQERSNLALHETSAKSIVAEATSNSEKIRASLEIQALEFAQAQGMAMEKVQEVTNWIEQHGRVLDALRSSSLPEMKAGFKLSGGEEALSLAHAVLAAGVPLTIVPEPTQVQCHDIDREVAQIIAELDHGVSSAVAALKTYSLALQRILPVNYLTTSPVHGWEQVLQLSVSSLSSDILSLARRQASDLIGKVRMNDFDSAKRDYDNLCLNVGKYAAEVERVENEYAELVSSIGPETEVRAKDNLLSAFMRCMDSSGFDVKEDALGLGALKHEGSIEIRFDTTEEKKESVLAILNAATSIIYKDVKHSLLNCLNRLTRGRNMVSGSWSDAGSVFSELEMQIEKSMLIAGFVNDLHQNISGDVPYADTENNSKASSQGNWASIFQTCLQSCKNLVGQMIEIVLPQVIKSFISFNSEAMDVFGSVSQIRGSIDTALEQLIAVELERASLLELEQNYFVKVGLITEQQLALEEAALKGRDHLSWEEAEELASQEEACRAQLDRLHQTWNQKDVRTSSLVKKESGVRSSLVSLEHYLQSLTILEHEEQPHVLRSKALLAALVLPFSELESIDQALSSFGGHIESSSPGINQLGDLINSGCLISQCIWNLPRMSSTHAFFIWKVSVIDSFLDSCTHDAASSVDLNLGFDQLVNVVKKKLETQLQEHIGQYLKERVVSILVRQLDEESETLKQISESRIDFAFDHMTKEIGAVKRVQLLLEEYCNAYETVRAARSAASLMKKQVNELKEALLKTSLEIIQMEWMHDISLSPLQNIRLICHKFLSSENDSLPIILNISRPKLLENIQSCIAKMAKSLDSLQAYERNSVAAEGQLERAMSWACGGPSSSAVGNSVSRTSGIPQEFHDHLIRRRQHLQEAGEKTSNIMKLCISVLEFEASRDGILWTTGELYPSRTSADQNSWQEVYLKILTKLEVTYHAFTRTEQEWKLAQSNVEAASSGLFSASNELCIASVKAQSASGDLQSTLLAMRDGAYEASVALSAFGDISRGHTALTNECGSMLEEVLAITEGLHDVHNSGKEAAALHFSMMENLAKANAILLPLESVLSKDVAAMTDAMARDREIKTELSPIHGQAIFQSYHTRIKEARQSFKPLVSPLTSSIKGLHAMLTRLARTASLHAGNLHKALEGLGESQEVRSHDTNPLRSDLGDHDNDENNKESEIFMKSDGENEEDFLSLASLSLQDKVWISPPESINSSSPESDVTSTETSLEDSSNDLDVVDTFSHSSDSGGAKSSSQYLSSTGTGVQNISSLEHSDSRNMLQDNSDVKFVHKTEASFLSQDKIAEESRETSFTNTEASAHKTKGKNAYAMSILRRVEMKIDGRDIAENREVNVAEQVDFLLKQATSLDNLCNMYEGWTPWI